MYLYVSTQRGDINQLGKPSWQNLSLTNECDYFQEISDIISCTQSNKLHLATFDQ